MTPRSAPPTEVAQRLWERAVGDSKMPEDVAATADRMCAQLYAGLGRWVGSMGYRTLLDRALVLARAEHPALAGLACLGGDQPGTTATQPAHSAAEVAGGMVALVAALVELLGRIIGEEMAVRLVEQTGIKAEQTGIKSEREGETEPARSREQREGPSPRGVVSTESRGTRNAHTG
jgi:hypothetical protein